MCVDVNIVPALEFLGQVVHKSLVKVAATKVAVPGGGLDGQLALLELDDGDSVVAVANVDEADAARLLLGGGEIELGDTPAQGSSGGVVDETEHLEAGNLGRVEKGAALNIGEPSRNAHAELGNRQLELGGGCLLDLAKIHGNQLGRGELLLVAKVVHLGANLAIDVDEGGGDVLLLDLGIGVVEGAAGEALQAVDGVLEVGDLLGLCRLAQVTGLGPEAYQRAVKGDQSVEGAPDTCREIAVTCDEVKYGIR